MTDRCIVKGCPLTKSTQDLLFCPNHREDWMRFCRDRNIHHYFSDKTINEFVKEFARG